MSKQDKLHKIGDLLETYFRKSKLWHKYKQSLIKESWVNVMGNVVAKSTTDISLSEKGLLIVKISSAPLRQQLTLDKDKILESLNKTHNRPILGLIVL